MTSTHNAAGAIDWAKAKTALAEPFDPKFVKFRPGREVGSQHQALAYIDGRDVMDAFDRIFGPDAWSFDYDVLQWGADKYGKAIALFVRGTLTVAGVSKSDIGEASNASPSKGAVSDALKRAAVLWGVGRYLYDHPVGLVTLDKYKRITPADMARLRAKLPRPGDAYADADEEDGEEEAVEHKTESQESHEESRQTSTQASTARQGATAATQGAPSTSQTSATVPAGRSAEDRAAFAAKNRELGERAGLVDMKTAAGKPIANKQFYTTAFLDYCGIKPDENGVIRSSDDQANAWRTHLLRMIAQKAKVERDAPADPTGGKLLNWQPDVPEGDEAISFDLETHPALAGAGRSN